MATEKKINSRIQQKHDVAANWAKATNFIPKKGEIIIYDAEYNASGEETQAVRFKIGDGSKTVNNLPFAVIDGEQKISGEFYFLKTEDGSIVGITDRGVMIMSKPNNPSLFVVGKDDDMDLYAALMVHSSGDTTSPSTITIGLGEPTVVQLEGQEAGSAKQVFTSQGSGATPRWTSVVNSLNGSTGDITGIATTSQLDNKQDKITSSNKLSSSLVSDLGAAAAKAVDTTISANSTSTNLPTSKAVEDRINAHSGIDKVGTITGIKMNSTSKGTSGVVDLGTVLTDASAFATAAQGTKADNAVPNTRKVNNKALSSDITLGAADVGVTETAFPGLKKTGTVTGVKMNGTTKNPSSGVVDLGTVLTSHQDISGKLDKTTYEWNKEFAAGSNGAISLGRYNVYDTQLTFDISSTTSASMNGKLVIATQNGRICQAKVFGDANGILVSKIVIYQSAIVNNRSWIEIFCNFDGWSKNKVHIYGVALNSATVTNQMSSVTFTNGIPSPITSGDYGWSGTIDNDLSNWTGSTGTISIHRGSMTFSAKSGDTYGTAGFDVNNAGDNSCGGWSVDENTAHLRLGIDGACDIELGEDAGTAGQVLTSQGAGATPQWKSMPTYSLSGTTLTITLP